MASTTCLNQHSPSINPSSDLNLFKLLTSTSIPSNSNPNGNDNNITFSNFNRDRRPRLDPLIVRAAALSAPSQTRNHYLHEYFPHCHNHHHQPLTSKTNENIFKRQPSKEQSKQPVPINHTRNNVIINQPPPPLSQKLISQETLQSSTPAPTPDLKNQPSRSKTPSSVNSIQDSVEKLRRDLTNQNLRKVSSKPQNPSPRSSNPINVQCQAKTRIPSDHGNLWLHLYTNGLDDKEHLALVIDRSDRQPKIKSQSLNRVWKDSETRIDRIIRGADETFEPSKEPVAELPSMEELPIVRIHSECFTGEILGSRRCDCGEQLDRSIEFIFNQPPHQGVIIYLRQEGRGIGLKNKIKAYNLQDLGFDTVEANQLLGFDDDLRDYRVASRIIEDLGLEKIRLMTNNPKKLEAFQNIDRESSSSSSSIVRNGSNQRAIEVVQRISMIPYQWERKICCNKKNVLESDRTSSSSITMVADEGKGQSRSKNSSQDEKSNELETYLRTKVMRMNHLIPLPESTEDSSLT